MQKKDTIENIIQDTVSTPTVTPSLTTTITPPTPSSVPVPTVASVPAATTAATPSTSTLPSKANWFTTTNTDVYESPNLASKKIGKVNSGKGFTAIEETNYYIKTNFDESGSTGYILKVCLRKNGSGASSSSRKKENKAEEMETKTVNNLLPTSGSEEKEPELK